MQRVGQLFANINAMAVAPFKQNLSLGTVFLLFLLFLILAGQWRLIVDQIEEVV